MLDFYCDKKKLGIELDGGQHGEAAGYDEKRDAWLQLQGISVLRFWNNQMLAETEAVMEAIYRVLVESEEKTPVPLSRKRERGRGEGC
ncbi:endonuclease domain-containing protein [Sideroxydans lithotrophicus]|uniref:endonuclease domain-containing protein n=1 Tax=Sideroxydans lithotrophicus TaxID=63745 RepID=UPI003F8D8CF7